MVTSLEPISSLSQSLTSQSRLFIELSNEQKLSYFFFSMKPSMRKFYSHLAGFFSFCSIYLEIFIIKKARSSESDVWKQNFIVFKD